MPSDRMLEYYYAMGQDSVHLENYEDAVTYFKKAANMGAAEAVREISLLARRFETGDGVPKNEEKARLYYEISAGYDDAEACYLLGSLYARGVSGAVPNVRKARKNLERACELGSRDAAVLLARLCDEGALGRVNHARAFKYYLLAAEMGDSASMLMTGLFYAQGDGAPKDLAAAEEWIRKGKAAGDPDGRSTLRAFLSVAAAEYATGAAGVVSHEKAFALAKEAESLGNEEAFLTLGETYLRKDKSKDHGERAWKCFNAAEDRMLPGILEALAFCLESGIGTAPDIKRAVFFYRKAAEAGRPFAMARLGYAFEMGEGVEKDEDRAMFWLIKAAMQGDKGAILTLKEDYDYKV